MNITKIEALLVGFGTNNEKEIVKTPTELTGKDGNKYYRAIVKIAAPTENGNSKIQQLNLLFSRPTNNAAATLLKSTNSVDREIINKFLTPVWIDVDKNGKEIITKTPTENSLARVEIFMAENNIFYQTTNDKNVTSSWAVVGIGITHNQAFNNLKKQAAYFIERGDVSPDAENVLELELNNTERV